VGFEKLFDCAGCVEVTLILKDFKTVTGRLIKDRNPFGHFTPGFVKPGFGSIHNDKCDDHKDHKDKCDDHKDHKEKCVCGSDFILLELTKDAESVSLREIEINGGFRIEWVNVEFPEGSCIAVNVSNIIYAGVNANIDKEKFSIGQMTTEPAPAPEPAEPEA